MDLLDKAKFARDIDRSNREKIHDEIGEDAKVILERWTGSCGMCGHKDWFVSSTTISEAISAHIVCGYCGGAYLMLPAALRQHERDKAEQESKADGK